MTNIIVIAILAAVVAMGIVAFLGMTRKERNDRTVDREDSRAKTR